jgi:hypothetical protein
MAENFTYAGIPGYGSAPHAYTSLDQSRADYWSGGKQKKQLDLNALYQDKFNLLNTLNTQTTQNQFQTAQARQNLETGFISGVKQSMGGGKSLGNFFKKGVGEQSEKSLWQDPTKNAWWDMSEFGAGVNSPYASQKWIPNVGKPIPPGVPGVTTKVIDGVTHTKNPNWGLGQSLASAGNWAAGSSLGKIGTWGAGAPSSIAGIGGALISQFGGDDDPTTHTDMEKIGTGLSWGSTAWKVAAMINPVLAVPAAIGAAWYGNKMKTEQAEKFQKQQDLAKEKWDKMVLDFRKDMRQTSYIGGTKGADFNWWQSNLT